MLSTDLSRLSVCAAGSFGADGRSMQHDRTVPERRARLVAAANDRSAGASCIAALKLQLAQQLARIAASVVAAAGTAAGKAGFVHSG